MPFWAELDGEHARRALNSAIWRLRKLLAGQGESIERDSLQSAGSDIMLEPARWFDIDAAALQEAAALAARQPTSLDDPVTLDHVAAVLRRYEGPLLDGDEGDWILEERERLHSLFLRTATLVVRRMGAAGRFDEGVGIARRALQFDPYREELVCHLLALLVLDERRCEAIQYFANWSRALKAELDIAPLPATRKLIEELRTLDAAEGLNSLQARFIDRRA